MDTSSLSSAFVVRGVLAALFGLALIVGAAGTADGQTGCVTNVHLVGSAAELDTAIGCYNAQTPSGTHEITFTGDILGVSATEPVTQAIDGNAFLIIDGGGFALTGPGAIAGENWLLWHDSPASMLVNNLTLAEADTAAILNSDGYVRVFRSTLEANSSVGYYSGGGVSVIAASSLISNGSAGLRTFGGTVLVSQSTFSENQNGITAFGAAATIANSTIDASIDQSIVADNGAVEVVSSIINGSCQLTGSGQIVDEGNNFGKAGDSSCGFTDLSADSLDPAGAQSNGGPTKTVALFGGSNAIGGGECADTPVDLFRDGSQVLLPLPTDQRFFPRVTPCDAGAYEFGCGTSGVVSSVASAQELDDAIHCYNAQKPAGVHFVAFANDITHPTGPPTIGQSKDDTATLSLLGRGFTLSGPGRSGTLLDHQSPAGMEVTMLTVRDATTNGIGVGNGAVRVIASTLAHNELAGLETTGGSTWIGNSAVHDNGSDGVVVLDGSVLFSNSTSHGNSFGGLTVGDGSVIVSNATFHGNGLDSILVADGSVTVQSSILNGQCLVIGTGTLTMIGNNFGLAFTSSCGPEVTPLSPGSLATDLADNGGGTHTVALLAGSNAIGRGDCTDVPVFLDQLGTLAGTLDFDQRGFGFPRTKASICDAGAFETDCVNPFADVADGSYFTDPVIWAACNSLTTGKTPTSFAPAETLTRAQLATFLWRYAGEPTGPPTNPFTDVPDGQYYSEAVKWLFDQGITTGTSPTTFSPSDPVTRAQMATFLWRYAGEPTGAPTNPFTDVSDGQYYNTAVDWMAHTGITTGTTPTTYSPLEPLTRGQAVTFLLRLALWQNGDLTPN